MRGLVDRSEPEPTVTIYLVMDLDTKANSVVDPASVANWGYRDRQTETAPFLVVDTSGSAASRLRR